VRRAARRLGVVLRIRPQLERHGHPILARQQCGDRGVDPAAHRDEDAAIVRLDRGVDPGGRTQRAVQGIGD
jgi:hypothetical protein